MAPTTECQPSRQLSCHKRWKTKHKKKISKLKKKETTGCSKYWFMKVQTVLKKSQGPQQNGFWNPTQRLPRKKIRKFYSDDQGVMRYTDFDLGSREEYARYAVKEVLTPSNDPKFAEQTRDTIEVTDGMSFSMSRMKTVIEKKDGQHLIDQVQLEGMAYDANDFADDEETKAPLNRHKEMSRQFAVASQTLLAASPNSLGPPLNPCIRYLKLQKVKNRGDGLSEWRSPFIPTLNGANGHKALLDNQVTAIVWILSRFFGSLPVLRSLNTRKPVLPESNVDKENRNDLAGPPYRGGILADSMGLGKTLTTVATLALMAEQRLHIWAEDGRLIHRPMLLLTPNSTVTRQWIFEFLQNTRHKAFQKVITSGNGLEKIFDAQAFSGLDRSRLSVLSAKDFNAGIWNRDSKYVWNESDPRAAQTIIVMSIDTWAHRTCKSMATQTGPRSYSSDFTQQGRRFSVVAVDEAHRVKNNKTKLWNSVNLLERHFTLLITATPALNTLADLYGLAGLLSSASEEFIANDPRFEKTNLNTLDLLEGLSISDPSHLLAGHLPIIGKLTNNGNAFTQKFDLSKTRKYLKRFEKLAILQRAPTSSIPYDWTGKKGLLLKGLFPKVRNRTIMIEPSVYYAKKYQKTHARLLLCYIRSLQILFKKSEKDSETAKEFPESVNPTSDKNPKDKDSRLGVVYRSFAIVSASLDVSRLQDLLEKNDFSTKIDDLVTMRHNGITLLDLAVFLRDHNDKTPAPKTGVDFVKLATRQSPVLRQIIAYIQDNIITLDRKEKIRKLLITEDIPALAWYYEMVLQFLGLNCRTLHSALSPEERQELVEDFNSESPESCQILIQMYKVGAAGTNLHNNCSRVLIATQSHSLRMQGQATHRVIRFGQTEEVEVCRIIVRNSFHGFRESRQVDKILPELSARVQYATNPQFVALLNAFQHESGQAWDTEEGKALLQNKSLLVDHSPLVAVKSEDPENDKKSVNCSTTKVVTGPRGWSLWGKTKEQQDMAFLLPRTRRGYYDAYRSLSEAEKIEFDHNKNALRRLLMYSASDGQRTQRKFKANDLEEPHILERALELQIRVQLGAGPLTMLPIPQITLPHISKAKIKELNREIGLVKKFECDDDKEMKVLTIKTEEDPNDIENDEELEDDDRDADHQGNLCGFVVADTAPVVQTDWRDELDDMDDTKGDTDDESISSGDNKEEGEIDRADGTLGYRTRGWTKPLEVESRRKNPINIKRKLPFESEQMQEPKRVRFILQGKYKQEPVEDETKPDLTQSFIKPFETPTKTDGQDIKMMEPQSCKGSFTPGLVKQEPLEDDKKSISIRSTTENLKPFSSTADHAIKTESQLWEGSLKADAVKQELGALEAIPRFKREPSTEEVAHISTLAEQGPQGYSQTGTVGDPFEID